MPNVFMLILVLLSAADEVATSPVFGKPLTSIELSERMSLEVRDIRVDINKEKGVFARSGLNLVLLSVDNQGWHSKTVDQTELRRSTYQLEYILKDGIDPKLQYSPLKIGNTRLVELSFGTGFYEYFYLDGFTIEKVHGGFFESRLAPPQYDPLTNSFTTMNKSYELDLSLSYCYRKYILEQSEQDSGSAFGAVLQGMTCH